jgi:hypothetical protein
MATQEELKKRYEGLYRYMAASKQTEYMMRFGDVMNEMMEWMIANQPNAAQEWIDKLECIKWDNYLTPKEADSIVATMNPQRPWTREQWKDAMEKHGYMLEEEPYYNRCAMYVTMSMIYSDSYDTLNRYTSGGDIFEVIHALALDKLKDRDGVFSVRTYFGV